MGTFAFRDIEYDYDILVKLMCEGHLTPVDRTLIVSGDQDDYNIKLTETVLENLPPVAIKLDGVHHLLIGKLIGKHNKPTLRVITKFTLKKCAIVKEPPKAIDTRTHQERWNDEQQKRTPYYNTNPSAY